MASGKLTLMLIGPRFWVLTLLLAGGALLPGAGQKKPVTIDDVVSRHPPSPLTPTWSPDGNAFVYVETGNVYLYTVSGRKAKVWFSTDKLEDSALKPKEGGAFNWQNRRVSSDSYQWFPNSRDLLASVKGDLFTVHPDGNFDQITKTETDEEDPKLSPDGTAILYRSKSNLFVLDIVTKAVRQLTTDGTPTLLNGQLDWVYPEELDLGTATWWSPDSKYIAYLQFDVKDEFMYPHADLLGERAVGEPQRFPQAGTPNALVKLGAISKQGGGTTWMNAGETKNALFARVDWLPDSSAIALERFTRVQDQMDLLFCDPATGAVRTILHEQSKTWLNVADNMFFLKARPEFLWTSERSGFRHIYRYSNKGELLAQLTDGDWMVTTISAVDEAKNRVLYTSTEATPLEWQLYSVPLSGGARTPITQKGSTHLIHANREGTYFLDAFSNLSKPAQSVVRNDSGEQLSVLRAADTKITEQYEILPTEIVQMKASPGGTLLYAKLIRPAGFKEGAKYPAVVYVYGGPGVQSVRNQWAGLSWEQALAHRGYVVWQLDNRGSNDRGHAFEEPLYREMGKQEVADQRAGVEHLIRMGFVDRNRIGITGWSYGGYMTIHCLLFCSRPFQSRCCRRAP